MLLDLRADAITGGEASRKERLVWRAWATTYSASTLAKAASTLARMGLRGADRLLRPRGTDADPRLLPTVIPERDPGALKAAHPAEQPSQTVAAAPTAAESSAVGDVVALFRQRATENGITVVEAKPRARKGDHRIEASGAIATTGSVLLTGDAAARRPLLGASRVVVTVQGGSVVRYPSNLEMLLGDGEALILTGASRTADIEKQIVRGIHGSEELVVVLVGGGAAKQRDNSIPRKGVDFEGT
jgi:hypothetical protein